MAVRESDEAYFAREAKLRQQLEDGFPESWRQEAPGDMIVGTFRGRETGHTAYGPKWIITLEDGQKKRWSVWLLHTVLENQFKRAAPAIGELVAIRYEGKVTPDGGGPQYDNWSVKVDRPEGATVDWNTSPGSPVARQEQAQQAAASGAGEQVAETPPVYADDDIPF